MTVRAPSGGFPGLVLTLLAGAGLILALRYPVGGVFRTGPLLDPLDGLYRTARAADRPPPAELRIGSLEAPVDVAWDDRGVPHVFAGSDLDAVRAAGYVTARDRLFQMDFLRRFTSGRLAEVFGTAALPTDRSMRRTGIRDAVRFNVDLARNEGRPTYDLFAAYAEGVNAYLAELEPRDLPFEFRLFGYEPEAFTAYDPGLIGWNLIFDLTYGRRPRLDIGRIDSLLGPETAAWLYPFDNPDSVPIVPLSESHWDRTPGVAGGSAVPIDGEARGGVDPAFLTIAEGYVDGKGSNNWAVGPSRSTTGAAILAGDMHLALWLPSIWYELHLVTPTMDTYGVTVPGVPLPIESFNRGLGWAFTNTGGEQIDHLVLQVDDDGSRYRYDGSWRPIRVVADTIRVRGGDPVADSVRWSHWGPVIESAGRSIAIRWTGLDTVRTFDALLAMNRAEDHAAFGDATRLWDAPVQNILIADRSGTIAIRSTGYMPIRADGGGAGYRDGSSSRSEWIGRIPFEELPHAIDPAQGYLTSTNQQPTGPGYPYFLGRDWRDTYRSIRIDALLSARDRHSPDDIASYQADVHAVQRDWFVPLLGRASDLSEGATRIRGLLEAWSGDTGTDRPEPLVLDELLAALERLTWDEPVFASVRKPSQGMLRRVLEGATGESWADRASTDRVETADDILSEALEATADTMAARYGTDPAGWTWGDHHQVVLRHVSQTPALGALWRGPFPYPGFSATLSPGDGRRVTASASWRVVLDFSGGRPRGRGIYAGGPSGNPFSRRYDAYVDDFLGFRYHTLPTPSTPDGLPVRSRIEPLPPQ